MKPEYEVGEEVWFIPKLYSDGLEPLPGKVMKYYKHANLNAHELMIDMVDIMCGWELYAIYPDDIIGYYDDPILKVLYDS